MSKDYLKWRPHPWHGIETGPNAPSLVSVFVEITPFNHIKYEVDKHSGYLKIDRPQYSSSRPPTVYGFIPKTYAGPKVSALMQGSKSGDQDPLDICVVSSHSISQCQVMLTAKVVGGIPMLDDGEADDKIVGILHGDAIYGDVTDISQLPASIIDQLIHYFETYKAKPVTLGKAYGHEHAENVVTASMQDYADEFDN